MRRQMGNTFPKGGKKPPRKKFDEIFPEYQPMTATTMTFGPQHTNATLAFMHRFAVVLLCVAAAHGQGRLSSIDDDRLLLDLQSNVSTWAEALRTNNPTRTSVDEDFAEIDRRQARGNARIAQYSSCIAQYRASIAPTERAIALYEQKTAMRNRITPQQNRAMSLEIDRNLKQGSSQREAARTCAERVRNSAPAGDVFSASDPSVPPPQPGREVAPIGPQPSGDTFRGNTGNGGGGFPAGVQPGGPDAHTDNINYCVYTPGGRRTVLQRGLLTIFAGCQINAKGEIRCIPESAKATCPGASDAAIRRLGPNEMVAWLNNRCTISCRADLYETPAAPPAESPATSYARAQSGRYCNARELVAGIFERYSTGNPIHIAKLKGPANTYLILLSGTEFKQGQATGIITDARLAMGQRAAYALAVMERAHQVIPKGARVILAGHSLGGMVAETVAGNRTFQSAYRTQEVITYGSPKVPGLDQAGTRYTRFHAVGDPVPSLTLSPDSRRSDYLFYQPGPEVRDPVAAHLSYPAITGLALHDLSMCMEWTETWDFPVPELQQRLQ